jgi:hypothetical protein
LLIASALNTALSQADSPARPAIPWRKVTGTWKAAADIFDTDNQNKAIGGESTRFGGRDEDEYLDETALVSWMRTPLQT